MDFSKQKPNLELVISGLERKEATRHLRVVKAELLEVESDSPELTGVSSTNHSDHERGNERPSLDTASSSSCHQPHPLEEGTERVSDAVYRLYKPTQVHNEGLDIFFFHGLECEMCPEIDCVRDAYLSTWRCEGEQWVLWPRKWLGEDFAQARIFSITYDCYTKKTDTGGIMDPYLIVENLLQEIESARKELGYNWPMILVGHGFGGIVIKRLCVYAQTVRFVDGHRISFLENLKGIFFYATPHHGVEEIEAKSQDEGPLLSYMRALNFKSARIHEAFRKLWGEMGYRWIIFGLGAQSTSTKGRIQVAEGSSRFGDHYMTVISDHFSVCRPSSRTCNKYQYLKQLIEDVQLRAQRERRQPLLVPGVTVGVDSLLTEIMERHLPNHAFVGMWGVGGIGKTTIAKLIFNKLQISSLEKRPRFEFTCFVEDMKQYCGRRDEVKREVWKKMHRYGVPVCSTNELFGKEWNQVTGKSLLVIFDGVERREHAELLKEIADMNDMKDSRFILTGRDAQCLKGCGDGLRILPLKPLEQQDAKRLLTMYSFPGGKEPPEPFRYVVDQVVGVCDGLPLTLEILGKYLKDKSINLWAEIPGSLTSCQEIISELKERVWAGVQLSYDGLLDEQVKHMFLDIASFFIYRNIPFEPEEAVMAWRSMYRSPENRLQILIDRSLLRLSHDTVDWENRPVVDWGDIDQSVFHMHEHVRRKGEKIARAGGRSCDFSRIRLPAAVDYNTYPYDDHAIFEEGLQLGEVVAHGMKISESFARTETCRLCIMRDVLPKFPKVQYMDLDVSFSGCCERCRSHDQLLALPKTLVLLSLSGNTGNLELPREAGGKLVALRCQRVEDIRRILSANSYTSLTKLKLSWCKNVDQLSESLGRLTGLQILDIQGSSYPVGSLPGKLWQLKGLERLVLKGVREVIELPVTIGHLRRLKYLRISKCRLKSMPRTFSYLKSLRFLEVTKIEGKQSIPNVIGELRQLRVLKMDCWAMDDLGEALRTLVALESLDLLCRGVSELSNTVGKLTRLKDLKLTAPLQFLPDAFGDLTSLEDLVLDCPIESFPQRFSNLSRLKTLRLENCQPGAVAGAVRGLTSLESLEVTVKGPGAVQDTFGELKKLRSFKLRCGAVTNDLVESFRGLRSLEDLNLRCGVGVLAAKLGFFSTLRILRIQCPSLQSLPATFGNFTRLQTLYIDDTGLHSLPDSLGQLSQLQDLRINQCEYLARVPDTLGDLLRLRSLELSSCENLHGLPVTIWGLSHLQSLSLHRLNKLTSIPEGLETLRSLQDLVISYCSVGSLPESLGQLSSLTSLGVLWCDNLETLPRTIGGLSSLVSLSIKGSTLHSLPDAVGYLLNLKSLDIRSCKDLKVPIDVTENIPHLEILRDEGSSNSMISSLT